MRTFRAFDWCTYGPHVLSFGISESGNTIEVSFYNGHPDKVFGSYSTMRNLVKDVEYLRKNRWKCKHKRSSNEKEKENIHSKE